MTNSKAEAQMVISAGHCPFTGRYGILSPVYYLERSQPNDVWGTSAENSILMKRRYQDLGSASDWSCRVGNLIQPIRRTTQIWVVMRHQYGISALVSQTSFGGKTSGSVAKCRLFSQATLFVICMKNEFRSKRGKTVLLLSTISSAWRPLNSILFNSSNVGNFFLELNCKRLSKSRKRKRKSLFHVVFTSSIKREIRHFHVVVVHSLLHSRF